MNNDLGSLIQQARKEQGFTQKELAKELGVSTGAVQQWELGVRKPRLPMLMKIFDTLHMPNLHKILSCDASALEQLKRQDDEVEPLLSELEAHKDDPKDIDLLAAYRKLNTDGQRVAIERVQELTLIPQYQRIETATDNTQANTPHTTEKPSEGK